MKTEKESRFKVNMKARQHAVEEYLFIADQKARSKAEKETLERAKAEATLKVKREACLRIEKNRSRDENDDK
jgi:hypothetical protein